MAQKGYISETMDGGRILSHGKITDQSKGFKLPNEALFSIYVRPKFGTSTVDTVLSVKCYQDEQFSEAPFAFNDWSPLSIKEIAPDKTLLASNDVYWGSGQYVEEAL